MFKTSMPQEIEETLLIDLMRAIVVGDTTLVKKLLADQPNLAHTPLGIGASRGQENDHFFEEIEHYLYAGDTPLHAAAAAYNLDIASTLVSSGANIAARNRRGAEALHYASDSGPERRSWNADAQESVIKFLIKSGANPNAVDMDGASPLHRAVRARSASAVRSLLGGGASVHLKNENGSTPLHLAVQNTGKSGSGSAESKAQQKIIIETLLQSGSNPEARDSKAKTVRQWIKEDWIKELIP